MTDATAPVTRETPPPVVAARRRPGLVALMIGHRFVASLFMALPLATLASTAVSRYPDPDAELFAPGGLMLLETVRLMRRGLPAVAMASVLFGSLAAVSGLVTLGAFIAGVGKRGRLSAREILATVTTRIGTLGLLWGASLAAQVGIIVLLVMTGGSVVEALHLGDRAEDIAHAVVVLLVLVAALGVGIVRDLAYVAAVDEGARLRAAIRKAVDVLVRWGARVVWANALRGLLSLGIVLSVVVLSPSLAASHGARLALSFVMHELAIAACVALRASWMAAAIRFVDHQPPELAAPLPESSPKVGVDTVDTM